MSNVARAFDSEGVCWLNLPNCNYNILLNDYFLISWFNAKENIEIREEKIT